VKVHELVWKNLIRSADLGTSFTTFIINTISFHFEQLDDTNFHCQMKFLGKCKTRSSKFRSRSLATDVILWEQQRLRFLGCSQRLSASLPRVYQSMKLLRGDLRLWFQREYLVDCTGNNMLGDVYHSGTHSRFKTQK
jgi:hypothetical protein